MKEISVDFSGYLQLGGFRQWVTVRGQDAGNPFALFLHGGPGLADSPMAHHFSSGLTAAWNVVHWDQRGANRSYSADMDPKSLTLRQIVSDAMELVAWIEGRFGARKVVLVGHSWGTILGCLLASRYSERFSALVSISQFVSVHENEVLSYRFALEEAGRAKNAQAVRELEEIGPYPFRNPRDLLVQRKWLCAFGGCLHGRSDYAYLDEIMSVAPEGNRPVSEFGASMEFSFGALWPALSVLDLRVEVPRLEVPFFALGGRYDRCTVAELSYRYFESLLAPAGKAFFWFDESAHWPHLEEPRRFAEIMQGEVLPAALHSGRDWPKSTVENLTASKGYPR